MLAYLVTNNLSNKAYVGITTRSINRRWYEHKYVKNSCGQLLAKAISKYGEKSFNIEPIASPIDKSVETLRDLEKILIKQFETMVPNGYNLTTGGDGVFGYKHTPQKIAEMSQSRKGKKASDITKQKMKEAHLGSKNHFYGKEHSDETKKKISLAKKGQIGPWLGKPRSEETRKKISESLKSKYLTRI